MHRLFNKIRMDYKDYIPQSISCWREGYSKATFLNDLFAGFTVGAITIPLAMAFAIGSGVDPERGLFTAIIAGFLISLLGGSRVQIGGPTGAFVIIVYSIVDRHGYDGLAIATLMAGIMMILMGLARFGFFLKFIPYSVTTGFTTGIALTIFTSQIKDFFGLCLTHQPADFISKWVSYYRDCHTVNPWALAIGALSLGCIFFTRKYPKLPGAVLIIILATMATTLFGLPVDTIVSKYGEIPSSLPMPYLPTVSFDTIQILFPDAIAIALLGAIESLLSAAVADGMTGHRHRSNCELVAQGFANLGSILFGGIPATGAIARTSTNIKAGAKTPVAGMVHALTVFLMMVCFAPLAGKVPLAALAAILIYVAWGMSELDHFYAILKGPRSDALVLVATFLLTILIDLTVAVQVGVLLSAILFLKRMTDSTTVNVCKFVLEEEAGSSQEARDSDIIFRKDVPSEVTVFEINGPFFFGVADLLNEKWRQFNTLPKIFILRMRKVPLVDATGIRALKDFQKKCHQNGVLFCLSGIKEEIRPILQTTNVIQQVGSERVFNHLDDALIFARQYIKASDSKKMKKTEINAYIETRKML